MGFFRGFLPAAAVLATARGLTLALVLATGTSAQRGSPQELNPFEEVRRALMTPHTTAELRRRLAALDAGAIPNLFLLAATGRVPDPETGAATPLSPDDRATLREALTTRPRREVVLYLEELASRPQENQMRLEALRLLGSIGTGDHLKLLVRLTTGPQAAPTVAPPLRNGFREALSEILARSPRAVAQLSMLLSESSPGLGSSIIEALGRLEGQEATRILATLLGRAPGLDPLILARLAERKRPEPQEGRAVFEAIRRYFHQRDPELVVAAIHASGRLGDDDAVETLVDLMEHSDRRVKDSVYEALGRISGLAFGTDAGRWTRWYHEEARWWDTEAEARLASIERGKGLEFVRAARETMEHRLYRDRMAESFVVALGRTDPEEVRLACRALERLGSTVAIPDLVECLSSDDAGVRGAAYGALRAITGLDLPAESDSWSELAG